MALLQKMGWQQGTGLGKHNEGKLEPLALDFKMDRKGQQEWFKYSIYDICFLLSI